MLWWIMFFISSITMYNYIGYAVNWSPQCCHIDCRIIVATSVSSLRQTALPTRPSLSPRGPVCTISTSDLVHHLLIRQRYTVATKQRARLRRMTQTTTNIRWTHIVMCLLQVVATKYSTCRSLNWHHLHRPPIEGAISSWSKFFSHTVLRRNSWPLELLLYRNPSYRFQHSSSLVTGPRFALPRAHDHVIGGDWIQSPPTYANQV
jgi:hypothetical protein